MYNAWIIYPNKDRCDVVAITNKIKKIAELLEQYAKEGIDIDLTNPESTSRIGSPSIIQELQHWLYNTESDSDNTESELQLATIFIKNYLKDSESSASLLIKFILPDIFNKRELKRMLKCDVFSHDERVRFNDTYLKNRYETTPIIMGSGFFSQGRNHDIQRAILETTPSPDLLQEIRFFLISRSNRTIAPPTKI